MTETWRDTHEYYEEYRGTEDKTLFCLANVMPQHIIEQLEILERNYLLYALRKVVKYLDPEVVKACRQGTPPN